MENFDRNTQINISSTNINGFNISRKELTKPGTASVCCVCVLFLSQTQHQPFPLRQVHSSFQTNFNFSHIALYMQITYLVRMKGNRGKERRGEKIICQRPTSDVFVHIVYRGSVSSQPPDASTHFPSPLTLFSSPPSLPVITQH